VVIEEPAHIEVIKVVEKVGELHPKDTISFADLDLLFLAFDLAIFDKSPALLVPLLRVVAPRSLPLVLISPRITKLDKVVPVDLCHVQDTVSVTLYDS